MVTDTYEYDVFGAVSAHSGSNASPWKFTGEQHEGAAGDTGYYFLRARYYDVDLGRFISRDPIEFDQRYAYAGGNPVLYVDPEGLCRNPFGSSGQSRWRRVADAFDCVGDAVTSDPVIITADIVAAEASFFAAVVTDVSGVSGCVLGGVVGCAVGYGTGWLATAPVRASSEALNLFTTMAVCARQSSSCSDRASSLHTEIAVGLLDPNLQFLSNLQQAKETVLEFGPGAGGWFNSVAERIGH